MSILLVELVPQGIIFGADRNIHIEQKNIVHEEKGEDGIYIEQHHFHCSVSPRPKVLRWPKHKAVIGYVTNDATMGGMPTDEWLYDFIGDNSDFTSFETLAESLRLRVQEQRRIDEGGDEAKPMIIHLGGFEEKEGVQVPAVWVIRNDHDPPHLKDIRKEYLAIECVWTHQDVTRMNVTPKDIQAFLTAYAVRDDPFWFHQGFDLGTFNTLEAFLKAALRELRLNKAIDEQGPQTLLDWERQVRMSILMYGAYFQAYKEPYEQYVGGGVDTISIPWPE